MVYGSEVGIIFVVCRFDSIVGVGILWIGFWNFFLIWGDIFVEVVKRNFDCLLIFGEKKLFICYIINVYYLNKKFFLY